MEQRRDQLIVQSAPAIHPATKAELERAVEPEGVLPMVRSVAATLRAIKAAVDPEMVAIGLGL
jgi:hypothetical protein